MFNLEEFNIKLDTETIGKNFVYCDELDSTNSFLLETKEYAKDGTVVLSEFQFKGRGRRSREWVSPASLNLMFSILLIRDFNKIGLSLINLGASLAVARAFENLYQLKVDLKWPNDVLVEGRKLAGILVESSSKGEDLDRVVLGIGINVNQPNFVGKFNITPTSIKKEFHREVSRERLLSEVLNQFEEILLLAEENPSEITKSWKDRCKMLGEKIKIEDEGLFKQGVFEDIDKNGYLILKNQDGLETIYFGDVSLR